MLHFQCLIEPSVRFHMLYNKLSNKVSLKNQPPLYLFYISATRTDRFSRVKDNSVFTILTFTETGKYLPCYGSDSQGRKGEVKVIFKMSC